MMPQGKVVGDELRVSAFDVAKEVTLRFRITGTKQLAFRVRIAKWLFGIISRILGSHVLLIESD